MTKESFYNSLKNLNIEVTQNLYERFEIYYENLVSYNEKVNLTAITEKNDVFIKHFLDSVSLLSVCNIKKNSGVIDIGTGAGFPGIPLKIVRDDINLTLVDSLAKRVVFLNQMVELLNLKNTVAIHSRAEDLSNKEDFRQQYDYSVSRAVANMPVLLEYVSPFVKVGGQIILLKGSKTKDEIESSKNAIKVLGLKLEKVDKIELFDKVNEHYIVTFSKIKDTAKKYPRNSAQIKKNQL